MITYQTLLFLKMQDRNSHRHEKRPMISFYCENNIFKFRTQLSQSNWDIVLKCQDANFALVEFLKIYYFCIQPLVRLSRKRAQDKKWFNAGLKHTNKQN